MRSIQVSRSPNSRRLVTRTLTAGPLNLVINSVEGGVLDLIEATVGLFNVAWTLTPTKTVTLDVEQASRTTGPSVGAYLECARMLVDSAPAGLKATTASGAWMRGEMLPEGERWSMTVPFDDPSEGEGVDVEDMLSLVLTTGWRRLGWVPLHAGGATPPRRDGASGAGVVVCAGSGGGKTTFTIALVRRGWLSVGDDKMLISTFNGEPRAAAIKHMLNLDPGVSAWFPEAGAVSREPIYSTWTDKRRVSMAKLWPHAPTEEMRPTHLLVIERVRGRGGIQARPMTLPDRMSALLRQTVIPRDPTMAAPIIRTMTDLARAVEGYTLAVHDDAYETSEPIDRVVDLLA